MELSREHMAMILRLVLSEAEELTQEVERLRHELEHTHNNLEYARDALRECQNERKGNGSEAAILSEVFDQVRKDLETSRQYSRDLQNRLYAMSARVNWDTQPDMLAIVEQCKATKEIVGNGKIPAIKAIREITYWGLKEAKDWIDAKLLNG